MWARAREATSSGSGIATGSMPRRSPERSARSSPYFSPDGERIAYSSTLNVQLKVVPVTGGPPIMLASPGVGSGGGGAWAPDGWIYFDSPGRTEPHSGRRRDAGAGRSHSTPPPTKSGTPGPPPCRTTRAWCTARVGTSIPQDFDLVAYDFATKERHVLTKGLLARYVDPGLPRLPAGRRRGARRTIRPGQARAHRTRRAAVRGRHDQALRLR